MSEGNLELYFGPYDGHRMEMPVTNVEPGINQRPASVNMFGHLYKISKTEDQPDKNPKKGVKYIGVYSGRVSK